MAAARGKASQPPSSVSGAQKQRLNDLFQPQAPLFKQPRGGHARRSSISAEAQAIAVGRRGSIVAQAGVAAMAALKGASSSSPSGGARAGANAGLPHLSPSSTSTRSCEEVTRRQGFLFDHDYARIMRETGYGRVEVYDLFMQFKALSALSSSPEGVDKDTFVRLTPTLMMEDSAFVGRVFDLLDVDGSGTIEWEEYLMAMNILSHSSAQEKPKPKHEPKRGRDAGGKGSRRESLDVGDLLANLRQTQAIAELSDRPGTPEEEHSDDAFGRLARTLQKDMPGGGVGGERGGRLKRPTDALAQRQLMAEFLFKAYDSDGGGQISEEEFFDALMGSFYVHRGQAEERYEACLSARTEAQERDAAAKDRAAKNRTRLDRLSRDYAAGTDDRDGASGRVSPPSTHVAEEEEEGGGGDAHVKSMDERANEYCASKFGRALPFNDVDADTIVLFRDVVTRTFGIIDANGSGEISCREAVAYVTLHPELLDVGALFGRSMLTGPEGDVKHLVSIAKVEEAKRAAVDSAGREARRAAVFDALFRGERREAVSSVSAHPQRKGDSDDAAAFTGLNTTVDVEGDGVEDVSAQEQQQPAPVRSRTAQLGI